MQKNKKIIIISGPTAVGKTDLALDLAEELCTDIISADSRQVYKGLNIGTAKPTAEQQERVKHHLIDILDLDEKISAGKWNSLAEEIIHENEISLVVGGTAFYLESLISGLDDFPEVSEQHIDDLNHIFQTKGIISLQDELSQSDPIYFNNVDQNNPHRLIRALSIIRETGRPFSEFLSDKKTSNDQIISIALLRDREELYSRINSRVDQMMSNGLLDEVKNLENFQNLQSLKTVGYQEFFPYFKNEYDLSTAIDLVKRNSRRYAKRQLTWFRNQGNWINMNASDATKQEILNLIS